MNNYPPQTDGALAPTRYRARSSKFANSQFSKQEDQLLTNLVKQNLPWEIIATHFPDKSMKQVIAHWTKVLDPVIVRGGWTQEEDLKILEWVSEHGPKKWEGMAAQLPGRIAKQCRERYVNHLDPHVNKGEWTEEEDQAITHLVSQYGTKWSLISKHLPGRTDNSIKNRYNSMKKKQEYLDNLCKQNIPSLYHRLVNRSQNPGYLGGTTVQNGPIILAPLGSTSAPQI